MGLYERQQDANQNAMQAASAAAAAAENQMKVMSHASKLRLLESNAAQRAAGSANRYTGFTTSSRGGGRGSGSTSGGSSTSSSGVGSADPRLALQAADLAFKSGSQDKSIAAADRDRADRLAAQKDITNANIAGRISENKASSENEDELRRKAALRALETFNSSKPGTEPGLSNQGKIA